MDWAAAVDNYCERTGPELWSEPLNAVTNLGFLMVALLMWRRAGADRTGRAMVAVLAAIGIGSGLFHTLALRWAGLADVLPILGFILLYLYASLRGYLGLGWLAAGLGTLAFLPYAAATTPLFALIPGIGSSAGYAPIPVLILAIAAMARRRAPATAKGLAIGTAMLGLSILLRSLDQPLCQTWPIGTHFLWHLLNAAMLGWMIEVWLRHRRHPRPPLAGKGHSD